MRISAFNSIKISYSRIQIFPDVAKCGTEYKNDASPISKLMNPKTRPRFISRVRASSGIVVIKKPMSYDANITPETVELNSKRFSIVEMAVSRAPLIAKP